jgi:hypothetical protein
VTSFRKAFLGSPRLAGCFSCCRRLDLRNHIPAVISQPQLEAAIEASRTSAERLLEDARDDYPELDFPPGYRLECLHGRHRTLAAAQVLPLEDRRWTVDLYLEGMTSLFRIQRSR